MSSIFCINKIQLISSISHRSNNTDCTICREDINNDSIYAQSEGKRSNVKTGLCGHVFHDECITPWLKCNNKCPICIQKFA